MFLPVEVIAMLKLRDVKVHWRYLFLELMLVFLMIALLMTAFLQQAPRFMQKARLLTVLMTPAFEGRLRVVEDHALSGDWPSAAGPDQIPPLKVVYGRAVDEDNFSIWRNDVQPGGYIKQGAIHIEIQNLRGDHPGAPSEWWSIRPAVAADDGPTVIWVCGSHLPPAGFHALGENRTTIPPEENFHICR